VWAGVEAFRVAALRAAAAAGDLEEDDPAERVAVGLHAANRHVPRAERPDAESEPAQAPAGHGHPRVPRDRDAEVADSARAVLLFLGIAADRVPVEVDLDAIGAHDQSVVSTVDEVGLELDVRLHGIPAFQGAGVG